MSIGWRGDFLFHGVPMRKKQSPEEIRRRAVKSAATRAANAAAKSTVTRATLPQWPELLTEKAVSKLLGVHPVTLAKWRVKGIGPGWIKISRNVRFSPEVVDAWLQARAHQSTAGDAVQ